MGGGLRGGEGQLLTFFPCLLRGGLLRLRGLFFEGGLHRGFTVNYRLFQYCFAYYKQFIDFA